jgi:nijmegen breakage syndrome protein 1
MQDSNHGNTKNQSSRKRPAPPSEEENEEDFMDSLAPAATAIKRRRLEEQEEARRTGKKLTETSFLQSQIKIEPPKPKKIKKEINIKDAVRERREAEEERARQDEENLRETLEGMTVEEMKKLAVVEEMEVLERSDRPQRREANGGASDRWDPAWNGRRNFKKFRQQGENSNPRRGRSVMVPLEEVKKKDFGIGEEYWDEPDDKKKKRKDKERATQSQSQTLSSAKSQHTAEVPSELMANGEDLEIIDVDTPRTTRHTAHTQEAEESDTGFRAINGKRPAPSRAKAPPAKKQKVLVAQDSESDSDDDELKFRFKKKR